MDFANLLRCIHNSQYGSDSQRHQSHKSNSRPEFGIVRVIPWHFGQLQGTRQRLRIGIFVMVSGTMRIVNSTSFVKGASRFQSLDHSEPCLFLIGEAGSLSEVFGVGVVEDQFFLVCVVAGEWAVVLQLAQVADEALEGLRQDVLDSPPVGGILPFLLHEALAQDEALVVAGAWVLLGDDWDHVLPAGPTVALAGDEAGEMVEGPASERHSVMKLFTSAVHPLPHVVFVPGWPIDFLALEFVDGFRQLDFPILDLLLAAVYALQRPGRLKQGECSHSKFHVPEESSLFGVAVSKSLESLHRATNIIITASGYGTWPLVFISTHC